MSSLVIYLPGIGKRHIIMENDKIEIDLLKLTKALWKKAWVIVLVAAVFGGAMFAYGRHTYVPQYTATATLYTSYQNNRDFAYGENSGNISQSSLSDARNLVKTCISVLSTRTLQEEVIRQAGLDLNHAQLRAMITAKSVNDTELFTVTVTTNNAEQAALIANTVAQILPEKVAMINASSYVGIIDSALVPNSPNRNDIAKNAVIAAALGAFLVCGVVVVREIAAEWKEQKAK